MISNNKRRQFSAGEKKKIVEEVLRQKRAGRTVGDACAHLLISRSQFYRWKKEYQRMLAGDADALEPRSRRPKKLARQTPKPVQDRVIALARTREFTSAHAIAKRLREQGEKITASSVIQILEREGLYGYVPIKDKTGRVVAKKSGLRC